MLRTNPVGLWKYAVIFSTTAVIFSTTLVIFRTNPVIVRIPSVKFATNSGKKNQFRTIQPYLGQINKFPGKSSQIKDESSYI